MKCRIVTAFFLVFVQAHFIQGQRPTQSRQTQRTGAIETQSNAEARATLKEYVQALQISPNDRELRAKILRLAATLKPAPELPEQARRYYVKANTLRKEAKAGQEVEPAISAYEQAILLAPWWADAYYNMSLALELAGRYSDAITAVKLYLESNPQDARAAQDRVYALEAAQERAEIEVKQKQEQAARDRALRNEIQRKRDAEVDRQKLEDFIISLHGQWRVRTCYITIDLTHERGCTQEEERGRNWNQMDPTEMRFPAENTVIIDHTYRSFLARIVGTASAPSLNAISWRCVWNNGRETWETYADFQVLKDDESMFRFLIRCDDARGGVASQWWEKQK